MSTTAMSTTTMDTTTMDTVAPAAAAGRTRIKICGLTRAADVLDAVAAGADGLGFVFYGPSPRYVTPQQAGALMALAPPFVTTVALFVNAGLDEVRAVLAQAPAMLLQFHGDETAQQCADIADAVQKPFIRALRVEAGARPADLLEYEHNYRAAGGGRWFRGLLLDAHVDGYGGAGKVFDWSLIPKELGHRAVLSGGLNAHNATEAVAFVRPFAVDVSSGVEQAKGIKDSVRIADFIRAVRRADYAEF